jgi:hypothetical protein
MVSAIGDTLRTMVEIDAAVQAAGGWPGAFVPDAAEAGTSV